MAGGSPFDNRIRRLRFDHSEMTQRELAGRVGVTRQTVIALEANRYVPSLLLAVTLSIRLVLPGAVAPNLASVGELTPDYLAMNETDWLPTDSTGADEGSIDYLLETGDLTSFDDMRYELASLADELGM